MTDILIASSVLNAVLIISLLFYVARVRRRVDAAVNEVLAQEDATRKLGSELNAAQIAQPAYIAIHILNPMHLAARESWFARTFGSTAPKVIRRLVYDRVAKQMRTQLAEQGVEAEISVHLPGSVNRSTGK